MNGLVKPTIPYATATAYLKTPNLSSNFHELGLLVDQGCLPAGSYCDILAADRVAVVG